MVPNFLNYVVLSYVQHIFPEEQKNLGCGHTYEPGQGSQTCGPRATCGPRGHFVRHVMFVGKFYKIYFYIIKFIHQF